LDEQVGKKDDDQLRQDVELIEGVYDTFNDQLYRDGQLAPVFFGSAVNNFGVQELLDTFIRLAPAPRPRSADKRIIDPTEQKFSGFVFKIHANIDPRHRDRIAFLRVCSGKFERNKFFHHVRLNKDFRFSSPATFMAQEKNIIDEAFPGDVIGFKFLSRSRGMEGFESS
jgi:peptide chain release factor 3